MAKRHRAGAHSRVLFAPVPGAVLTVAQAQYERLPTNAGGRAQDGPTSPHDCAHMSMQDRHLIKIFNKPMLPVIRRRCVRNDLFYQSVDGNTLLIAAGAPLEAF
jgi:hypothetical protein